MATDNRSDFDLASLLQAPATAMAGFMGLADGARKAITGVLDTIASLQRTATALEALSGRMTSLLDDLEAPVRALTPEFERAMGRVQRVADAFEGPIDRLLPGLENAVETFDRVALSQLPENMDQLREQVITIVEAFSEFPRRMVGLAQLVPGLERLTSFRPIPAMTRPSAPEAAKPATAKAVVKKAVVKKAVVKKAVVKKAVVKKAVVKKAVVKKPVAKKAVAKKPVAKKPVAKKAAPRKAGTAGKPTKK